MEQLRIIHRMFIENENECKGNKFLEVLVNNVFIRRPSYHRMNIPKALISVQLGDLFLLIPLLASFHFDVVNFVTHSHNIPYHSHHFS